MNDYQVSWVQDGSNALEVFHSDDFAIGILDVMLPNIDGFTIGKQIKAVSRNTPIIFLTAKSMKEDILQGYSIGADDYITKPFDSEVLIAKIRAVLMRAGNLSGVEKNSILKIGKYNFDPYLRQLTLGDTSVKLSPKESDLLEMLLKYKNELMPRSLALNTIWGDDSYFTTRSMDVYITKIRKYLKQDPEIQIENIHGSGYRLILNT